MSTRRHLIAYEPRDERPCIGISLVSRMHSVICACGCVPVGVPSLFQMAELRAKRKQLENEVQAFVDEQLASTDNRTKLCLSRMSLTGEHLIPKRPFADLSMSLLELHIDHNNLSYIPNGFLPLFATLRRLALNNNQLTSLPDDIGALKNLEECILDANPLQCITMNVSQCSKLASLHVNCMTCQIIIPVSIFVALPQLTIYARESNVDVSTFSHHVNVNIENRLLYK